MSFWRKIAGLAVRGVDEAECEECPPGLPGADPAFSTAVTALGAKLAKADGQAQSEEYDVFSVIFRADAGSEGAIRRLYQLARQTTRGFEGYARRLKKRYGGCPRLLEDVLDGLFYIAAADGVVTGDELSYLARVSELFGQSPLTFRRLKATYLGAANDDPYVILGVAPDAPDEAVRAAWRAHLSESHPDRARARGLPQEFVEVAEAKAASINAAYDEIVRDRKAMRLEGAA
ncbi:DnaJ family molecular chaperone [Phenylobacterium sp.]|uniref:J domain-containing protein n=1 Tax=Phenylobacterium sp. TaxID=1871053 RepID=UPI0025E1D0B0|nr:DnaJ family molecular chaperone [Phenylobacterium sp.]